MDTDKIILTGIKYVIPLILVFVLYLLLIKDRKKKIKRIRLIEKEDIQNSYEGLSIDLLYTLFYRDIAYLNKLGRSNLLLISTEKPDVELVSYHYLTDNFKKILFFDLNIYSEENWFNKILRKISLFIGVSDTGIFSHIVNLLAQKFKIESNKFDANELIKSLIVECKKQNVGICFQNINETTLLSNDSFLSFLEKTNFITLTSQDSTLINTLSSSVFTYVLPKDYISSIPLICACIEKSKNHKYRLDNNTIKGHDYEELLDSIIKNGTNFSIFNFWLYLSTGIESILNILNETYLPEDNLVLREMIEKKASSKLKKRFKKLNQKEKELIYMLSYAPFPYLKEKVTEYCIKNEIELNSITVLQQKSLLNCTNRLAYSNVLLEFYIVQHFYPNLLDVLFFNDTNIEHNEEGTILNMKDTNNFLLLSLLQHSSTHSIYNDNQSFYMHPWISDIWNEKVRDKYEQKALDFITHTLSRNQSSNEEVLKVLLELYEEENENVLEKFTIPKFSDDDDEQILDYYSFYLRMFFKIRVNGVCNHLP